MDYNDLIEPNEHGRPKLKGRRIRIQDIAIARHVWGWTIQHIIEQYQLSPGQVYACLSYYRRHRLKIDADIEADRDLSKQLPKLTDLLDNEE